jgi:hypothetical protein
MATTASVHPYWQGRRFGARGSVLDALMLLSWARVPVLFCRAHLSVRHQKRTGPVVVTLLADPIGDGYCCVGHLEPLAEGPGEALQQGPR